MIAFILLALSVVALAIVAHIYIKQNEVINEVVVEYGEGAVPLKKAHRGDACYDLCVSRDVILKNGRQVLPTEIRLGLPLGYHAFILPTSGNCSKGMNARIVNEAGEKVEHRIDADVEIGTIDNFAGMPREEMELKPVEDRKGNFEPIFKGLTCEQGQCEASRCLQCDLRVPIQKVQNFNTYAER